MTESTRNPLIIGAGPAGLTAALVLAKRGVTPRLYEASGHVGGLARTPSDGDWRVDPGGHRFFTRSEEVSDMWRALLPADQWISVPRRSAMLVNGHYVRYPLVGRNLLTQMGLRSGMHGLSSLAWSRFRRRAHLVERTASFRDWGTNEFGRYWYDMFFDGYVRKTWLTDPNEITSEWANQRIKPIGWRLDKERQFEDQDVFRYPRLGPGQLWEAAAAALADVGVVPSLDSRVVKVRFDGRAVGRRAAERRHRVRGRRVLQHAAAVAGGGLGTRAAEAHPGGRRGSQAPGTDHGRGRASEALRHPLQLGVHTWQQLSGRPDSELRPVVARTLPPTAGTARTWDSSTSSVRARICG